MIEQLLSSTLIPEELSVTPPELIWNSSAPLTLGVELEVQLVDWRSQDLCPAAQQVLDKTSSPLIKSEIFQSMVELCTSVCQNLDDVERDMGLARQQLLNACEPLGLEVVSSGTHPFAVPEKRRLSPGERYAMLLERRQWVARRICIFGLHVHVGVENPERAMHLMNGLLPYLAPLLALSASSPFWRGHDTGLAAARPSVFESLPGSGTPPTLHNYGEFEQLYGSLCRSGSISSLKDLWWDIRPKPSFGTIEVRVCDSPATMAETLGLVALIQCLSAEILNKMDAGETPVVPPLWLLHENKWRAMRKGLKAQILVDAHGTCEPVHQHLEKLLRRVRPMAKRLGCEQHLRAVRRRLQTGSSSAEQRKWRTTYGNLPAVVQHLAQAWREGAPRN